MKYLLGLTRRVDLTLRLVLIIGAGMLASALAISFQTEKILEQALLEQVKKQGHMFLLGIEQELIRSGAPQDRAVASRVLGQAQAYSDQALDISVLRLYAYDQHGEIIGYTGDNPPQPRQIRGKYSDVFTKGESYFGDDHEYAHHSKPRIDLIIPVHWQGEVVAGLEVELDLNQTIASIRHFDNQYKKSLLLILLITSGLLGAFLIYALHAGLITPIKRLSELTQRIAAGDFSGRVHRFDGHDSISRLGQAVHSMAANLEQMFNEQENSYLQSLQSLLKALEAKDSYTARHSARVTHYSVLLGRKLGLPQRELELLRQGALMHDLGKIGISDQILNKPGKLTDDEYAIMRSHPKMTAAIMRPLKRFHEFTDIATWHHERWDGKGYPDGLKGEQIPLLARIVAIADTWDAMTGDRVYREGMPAEKALAILRAERDSGQWDPQLIDRFIEMMEESQNSAERKDETLGTVELAVVPTH